MIEAAAQTDEEEGGGQEGGSQKDLVIKALAQMVWNKRAESVPLSTSAPAGCECDAAKALRNLFSEPPSASVAAASPSAGALEEETEEEKEGDDPLKRILRTRTKRRDKARTAGVLEGKDSGRVPLVESPPLPHPEAASNARQEKKEALKIQLWAARERVDRLRKENGALEELLREGSEAGRNPTTERYGDDFDYD